MKKAAFILLLVGFAACKSHNTENETPSTPAETPVNPNIPVAIQYAIVNIYPHDPAAFTEGLEYRDGALYESSGEYGVSDVRKTDLVTGKVLQATKMAKQYFGEGITVLNNKLYQLTYKEQTGFVYDFKTLKQQRTFTFKTREGWGMTNDGTNLIYGDGSDVLFYLDPATMNVVKQVKVTDENGPVTYINELELIKGFIYANIWQRDIIVKIDPATGKVVGRVDMGDIREKIGIQQPVANVRNAPEVLNGIAYDSTNNKIYITGKYWPKLLEVKLDN